MTQTTTETLTPNEAWAMLHPQFCEGRLSREEWAVARIAAKAKLAEIAKDDG